MPTRSAGPPGRVIVVGGGAAGLAAGAALARRTEVVLVEARDRLGGRVDTRLDPVLGIPVERGAEFVHGRPPRTLALARRAGVKVLEIPDQHARPPGKSTSRAVRTFEAGEQLLSLGERDDEPFAEVVARARRARRIDDATVEMAASFVRGFYLADPRTASSLALARFTRALDAIDGDVNQRTATGYAAVLAPLVDALRRGRAAIRLSSVVEQVAWRPGHVTVAVRGPAGGRLELEAEAAVITLPLALLGAVRFRPALPEKRRAAAALEMGPVVKVLLRFRGPMWATRGEDALTFLHVPGAAFPVFWTLAPLRAPVLAGWAGGPDAVPLAGRPEHEVLGAALRSVARGLGRPMAELQEHLDGAYVADWTRDPFARGGYAVFPVGSAGAAAELARSVAGTLFFAGEATAGDLAGTVEGALRTGERAARELLGDRARGPAR